MKTSIPSRTLSSLLFLEQIRRPLLEQFFDRFQAQFADGRLLPRADGLDDSGYYFHVRFVLTSLESLPTDLVEGLQDIQAMACAEGQEHLERVLHWAEVRVAIPRRATEAEMAVRAWLEAPEAFEMARSELRLARLATFEYFGAANPVNRWGMLTPDELVLEKMQADTDEWFQRHGRGEETTLIQVHEMEEEWWFLVRHGDTFARKAKVEQRKTELLHYRPAKDDVVVYSPERDELRIHAGTAGETELYRRVLGERLFGERDYFCERKAYTLRPLREDGADALRAHDIQGIKRIALREVEVQSAERSMSTTVSHERDLFSAECERLPEGEIQRARFDVYFVRAQRARSVEVRPPNILKLGRHCDAPLVHRWLGKRGFRVTRRDGGTKD